MPFQEYEDGISYIERGSLPGAINYAQKSATESFPADDRRGSNNGGQQLVKQPLRGKSAYPLMFSGFCILACSVTLWMGMLFFTGYIPAASDFSLTYSHIGFPLLFLVSFLTGFFSLTGFYLGFPLLFLGAALLLIGLALRLKPAYSTVYGMCVSGAITLVLGLESLLALWIPFDSLRLVFHI